MNEDRAITLLNACRNLLNKQKESSYVLDLLTETVFYDGSDCDGYCLSDDIEDYLMEYEALLLESVVEQIVDTAPTLTPPNEPLTWNELDNMVEKPVYIVELEDGESCWVLVHTVDDIKALFVSAFDQYDYGNRELYGQTWLAYRRLPEVSP